MDYFENLVKTLLEEEYLWVGQSIKVDLTKQEKRDIGKHSIPRPEIDLLVFNYKKNEVIAIEAKSYLDSNGVGYDQLIEEHDIPAGRYKLFTCEKYRDIVFSCLKSQLLSAKQINNETTITLGLAAGNVHKNQSNEISTFFKSKGWLFWGPDEVKKRVKKLAEKSYENNPYIITTKVLMR